MYADNNRHAAFASPGPEAKLKKSVSLADSRKQVQQPRSRS